MHAFLLMVHTDSDFCGRLSARLSGSGRVFLHVDARVGWDSFQRACGGGIFIEQRTFVRWGAWTQTTATVALIEAALADPSTERVTLLSGQHYPIAPDLDGPPGVDRIAARPAPDPARGKPESRFTERFFPVGAPGSATAVLANGVARRLPALNWRKALGEHQLFAGSPYFSLTRPTAERVVAAARADTPLTRYFRRIASSDEAFVHTVVGNLDTATIDPRGTTYAKWAGGRHPLPLTPEDLPAAAAAGFLYARKFGSSDPALTAAADQLTRTA